MSENYRPWLYNTKKEGRTGIERRPEERMDYRGNYRISETVKETMGKADYTTRGEEAR